MTIFVIRFFDDSRATVPSHPQTQGKDERIHRTLKAELLCRMSAFNVAACQPHFDRFRDKYNHE